MEFECGGLGAGPSGYGLRFSEREDRAIEGVFKGDERGGCVVDVIIEASAGFDVREGQVVAVFGLDKNGESAREGSDAAGFPFVDVGAGVGEDGMWGLGHVGTDGELVAHGAGKDKEGGFMAGKVGDIGFEGLGGGVFDKDVVEKGTVFDSFEHGGGGGCNDIACICGTAVSGRLFTSRISSAVKEGMAYCGNRRQLSLVMTKHSAPGVRAGHRRRFACHAALLVQS